MQHPVGYRINTSTGTAAGERHRHDHVPEVRDLRVRPRDPGGLPDRRLRRARRRSLAPAPRAATSTSFRAAAKLAIVVVLSRDCVPALCGATSSGSTTTNAQPMKIAATEALWDTEQPASFSIFQIGGFTASDPDAELLDRDPRAAVVPRDGLVPRQGRGPEREPERRRQQQFGPGNYMPTIELAYWCMRVMAYLGGLMLLLALWGGWLLAPQAPRAGEVVPAGRGRPASRCRSSRASAAGS